MSNWMYYVLALAIIIGAAWAVKKVTSCLVKLIALAVILAVIAYVYFFIEHS